MKAKWLGLPKLMHWDRNAPLPEDDDRAIGWDEARERVLAAYGAFSPELAEVGERFFDQPWIDADAEAGQGGRRLRASDGAERASVPAAELPRQDA